MAFPVTRLRRLRRTSQLRDLVRETRLTPDAFVYPMFVCPGEGVRKAVRSMPGVFNLSVDEAVKEAQEVHSLGVPSVILFGLPDKKDEVATGAWADDGIVQQAARAHEARSTGSDSDGRRLPLRIHVARALRDRKAGIYAAIVGRCCPRRFAKCHAARHGGKGGEGPRKRKSYRRAGNDGGRSR